MSSPKHVMKNTDNCSQRDVVEKKERLLENFNYIMKGVKLNSGCGRLKKIVHLLLFLMWKVQ